MHLPVYPRRTKVFPNKLHQVVKPLPEGKVASGQWLFAELRVTERHYSIRINNWHLHVGIVEGLGGKVLLVAFCQSTTSFRSKLGGQHLDNTAQRHLIWHYKRHASGLCERVVPGNWCPSTRLLVSAQDKYEGKRHTPELEI